MEPSAQLSVQQVMMATPVVVSPQQTVQEVIRLMNWHRIGAVLVADRGRIAGIFTERDLLRHAAEAPPGWRQRPVADWMTREPWTIRPEAGWEEAVALMQRLHVRHLPVVSGGTIVGIVSARDLIARRSEHLNRLIEDRTRELQQANERLKQRDAELRLHMALAGKLQASIMLPGTPPTWPEITWGIHYAPVDPLGGDYYDFAQPDDQHLGILIADATGHSIAAALVAIMARTAFAAASRSEVQPGHVLADVNRHLHGLTADRFVTAFYGVLERQTRRFTYANAGHPFPLHCPHNTENYQPLAATGFMLGMLPDSVYEEDSVLLQPGDRLCFYTDGVVECQNEQYDSFGEKRLRGCLREEQQLSPAALAQRLVERLTVFRGDRPVRDDVTLVIAEIADA